MIGIVVSRADEASEHLGEHLRSLREWDERTDDGRPPEDGGGVYHRSGQFELRTFADLHLDLEGVADAFDDPDLLVFASRHSGETGPLLTAHFTGNLGPAEYGGEERTLAEAAPAALDRVLTALDAHAPEGYDSGIECTHHGPTAVGAPSLFVELGSGPEEWADPEAAAAVARAVLELDDVLAQDGFEGQGTDRTVVGLGGGHYAMRFERVVRETGWSVGHVAADWGLEALGDPREHAEVVGQLFERSGAERALVDGEHPAVEAVVADLGYDLVSETWLRAVDGVDLDLAGALAEDLTPVAEGLRFGTPALEHGDVVGDDEDGHADEGPVGTYEVVDLPDELLGAARSVDRERTRAAVEAYLLAYETTEGASKAAGRGAVAGADDFDCLVDALVGILEETYDRVERRADDVVAHETGFDPALARECGVPEGPKFGRLAEGRPVVVDGETVDPEDVTVDRTETFPLRSGW